jgi:hypothetical protein
MTDERDKTDQALEHRLANLPLDIAPRDDVWASIEQAIYDDRSDAELAELSTEIEPATDLWPAIAKRIDSAERSPRPRAGSGWQTASLLAACVAVVTAGVLLLVRLPVEPDIGQTTAENAIDFAIDSIFTETADAGASETQELLRNNIALVREQRAMIEASMQQYPNDASLRSLWQHTYETELSLVDSAERTLTTI